MDEKIIQEVLRNPWASELIDVIRQGGDIEEFIKKKDEKLREESLQSNSSIISLNKEIKSKENDITTLEKELQELEPLKLKIQEEKQRKTTLSQKIEELRSIYPASKSKKVLSDNQDSEASLFDEMVNQYAQNGEYNKITPKNFVERIKEGTKIKRGNKKFSEFVDFCEKHNLRKDLTEIHSSQMRLPEELEIEINNIENKIKEKKLKIEEAKQSIINTQHNIQRTIEDYDKEHIYQRQTENDKIRAFVQEKSEDILRPASITKEEIKTTGLSEKYIEGQVLQSQYPSEVRGSIRRFYEGLNEPAAFVMAVSPSREGADIFADKLLTSLKEIGLDAVKETDPRASDPSVFVVTKKSVHAPFLPPEEALRSNIAVIDKVKELGGSSGYPNPHTRESFVEAKHVTEHENISDLSQLHPEKAKQALKDFYKEFSAENSQSMQHLQELLPKLNAETKEKIEKDLREQASVFGGEMACSAQQQNTIASNVMKKYEDEVLQDAGCFNLYQRKMQQEAWEKGISPDIIAKDNVKALAEGKPPAHVFHGGWQGTKPYASVASEDGSDFIFGAVGVSYEFGSNSGALEYALAGGQHGGRSYGDHTYGFVYQYQSRAEKQEMLLLEGGRQFNGGYFDCSAVSGHGDETSIFPHQNKLEKIYIAVDEHISGTSSAERRLFPLELDENGQIKDKRWRDFAELHDPINDHLKGYMVDRRNNMIKQYDTLGKEAIMARRLEAKTAAKTANKAAVQSVEKTSVKTVGSVLQKADNAVNNAIETTIEKGAKALNESKVGKVYGKAAEKIGATKVAKGITKATGKVGEKIAKTAVAKAANKAVAKVAAKAVGKSVLKKIPLVSLAAGAYFAYDRAKQGDWAGAAGELTSGTLGCFPGLGTAASVAVDAGLAAKDIKQVVDANKAEKARMRADPKIQRIINEKRGVVQAKTSEKTVIPQQINENVQAAILASKSNSMG